MSSSRQTTFSGTLARLGFTDPTRAEGLVDDLGNACGFPDGIVPRDLVSALAEAPDPDLAVLGLVRMVESAQGDLREQLIAGLVAGSPARDRLLAVLGSSTALGDQLARHPDHWLVLDDDAAVLDAEGLRAEMLAAVGADAGSERPVATLERQAAYDAMRVAYRRRLLAVAGRDLALADPPAGMPEVARQLADLAAAALEAALAVARAEQPDGAPGCRIAVIGMGKCGGRELNYVSDVDVIYVVEPAGGTEDGPVVDTVRERAALATGTRLASALARACSVSTAEGSLWPVDAALRPEGKAGPLVRTVASHRAYYERWAETWEFQAQLKARVVAGDRELGERYLAAVGPLVWEAAQRENFVHDVQAMRRRVEEHVPARDGDRQLKLGRGGLRDVEFSVQLLQLVHGRADARLRGGNTLNALEALSTYGYVGRDDAAELDRAYRMLRALEHRLQLHRLSRTHVLPDAPDQLRRIGRSFGFRADPQDSLIALWRRHAMEVRRLHEKLFYRPLLAAAARLTTDEARLTPEAARARLSALGYRDPAGALRHLSALTAGVSRRAAIQRQLLAVMLGWFADGADPDAGLLGFRRISDALGSTHWYLKMLRDSGAAAERFALVLSSSRWTTELLLRGPEAVALLETDEALTPRTIDALAASMRLNIARHSDPAAAAMAARAVRRRELVRTGVADIVGIDDVHAVGHALSDAADSVLQAVLDVATADVTRRRGPLPARLLIVAMGRLGGREIGYGSDADVLFVVDPEPGADEHEVQQGAMAVFSELRKLLAAAGPEPGLEVDANLRPEGRNGPLLRTLSSYAEYYARWSAPWEAQALVRARPVAGDEDLGRAFVELADPVRWRRGGLDDAAVREIRRIKARVEAERLPRGADPQRHTKLGRGSLSDVEWTAQLIQMQHAWEVPGLRTTSTVATLEAAFAAELIREDDSRALIRAWELAARVRNAIALWRGRPSDSLPGNIRDMDGVARLAGYPPASAGQLDEDYQRTTRRARAVVERLFYGAD